MVEVTLRQARAMLAEYAEMAASRDERILTAYASGITVMEIHKITGLARTTIIRIIEGKNPDEHGEPGTAVLCQG